MALVTVVDVKQACWAHFVTTTFGAAFVATGKAWVAFVAVPKDVALLG